MKWFDSKLLVRPIHLILPFFEISNHNKLQYNHRLSLVLGIDLAESLIELFPFSLRIC